MIASQERQINIFRTRLSVLTMMGMFLDPIVIGLTLFASAAYHGERVDAHYVVLGLIAFSMSFPGFLRLQDTRGEVLRRVFGNWALLALVLTFFGYATGYLALYPPPVVLVWLVAAPVTLSACHLTLRYIVPRVLAKQTNQKTAVIAGMNTSGLRLGREFRSNPLTGTRLVGYFDDRSRQRLGAIGTRDTLLGTMRELATFTKENRIDLIYITLPMASQPRIIQLLDDLRDTTASIYFVPDIFVTDLIQGRTDSVAGLPVVAVCESPFTGMNGIIKRASDIVLSLLILLLITPVLLAIAIAVKASSPGPVLFRQRRYGLDGHEIVVYKFRSMTVCEDGPSIVQATRNDQRVTRVGAVLRRSSLDELPQFFNVLQGRMSIVGPRPHAVAHNELYRGLIKGYMVRHKVKPGITGWAQVNGHRGETDSVEKMQKRIEYDLEYLRHWSLTLDLWIIAKTVLVVLRDRNAY
jgi:putative colanic acid biosynthesis UDP-glucose lipid carrier transferase